MEKEKTEKKKYNYYTKAITCPDGTRKYIRGKTKKELNEKVRRAQSELSNGININDNTRFGELAQLWLDVYKRPHVKERTLHAVRSRLNTHVMPVMAHMRVRDIKPAHVAQVMNGASYLAHNTQAVLLSDMKSIFNCAVENGIIPRTPVPLSLRPGGSMPKEKVPLTPAECHALLEATKRKSLWVHVFTSLCLYTGLRASEACGLCWDCVDFEHNRILVRRQLLVRDATPYLTTDLKTANSARDIPAPPQLMNLLRSIKPLATTITVLSGRNGCMVHGGMANRALASVDIGVHVHPHLLRHTYATRLVENGLDMKEAQYLLGHTTPFMTMRVYSHYDRRSRDAITAEKVAGISFTETKPTASVCTPETNVANLLQISGG